MSNELKSGGSQDVSINLNVVPLPDVRNESIGFMLIIEDISSEKGVRGTMARYMTKEVFDRLLDDGESALGGSAQEVRILFSNIRGFTNIEIEYGPRSVSPMP